MTTLITFTTKEICQSTQISEYCLLEIVAHGIIKPQKTINNEWLFDAQAFNLIKKAIRLQHDLEMDWPATALVIQLLQQIEQIDADRQYLLQRLKRLESTNIKTL